MSASDSSKKGPAGPAAPRTSTRKEKAPVPPRARPKSFGPAVSSDKGKSKSRRPGGSFRRPGAGSGGSVRPVRPRRPSLFTSPRPDVSDLDLRADFLELLEQPEIAGLGLTTEVQEQLFEYGKFLALRSAQLNLISQEDRPRLFTRHVFECLAPGLVSHARGSKHLVDIGSGGGLPGIPLAIVAPELRALLVEPRQRKAQFLEAAVSASRLSDRVQVFQGTAEKLVLQSGASQAADLATARAVDRLAPIWRWAQGLLAPGGWLATYKGPAEIDAELESLEAPAPSATETHPCGSRPRVVLLIQKPR